MPGTDGEWRPVDPRLAELAQRTPNLGFLLAHEAVLFGNGAVADITWLRDPDDIDNLPPLEVIAQEIVDDLQAA